MFHCLFPQLLECHELRTIFGLLRGRCFKALCNSASLIKPKWLHALTLFVVLSRSNRCWDPLARFWKFFWHWLISVLWLADEVVKDHTFDVFGRLWPGAWFYSILSFLFYFSFYCSPQAACSAQVFTANLFRHFLICAKFLVWLSCHGPIISVSFKWLGHTFVVACIACCGKAPFYGNGLKSFAMLWDTWLIAATLMTFMLCSSAVLFGRPYRQSRSVLKGSLPFLYLIHRAHLWMFSLWRHGSADPSVFLLTASGGQWSVSSSLHAMYWCNFLHPHDMVRASFLI